LAQRLDIVPKHPPLAGDDPRMADAILEKLHYVLGRERADADMNDWFLVTAFALRDRVIDRWLESNRSASGKKRVYYLSIEYLIGRLLMDTICNMDAGRSVRSALASLDIDLDALRVLEPDAALGNGGLGRLAACFMDSLATLGIPAFGYGIRYEHGLFRQQIRDGWQHELPEDWLSFGNPWEIEHRKLVYPVRFGGAVEYVGGDSETPRAIWYPTETVEAVAFDTPIAGWRGRHVNTLRLWSARATEPIHFHTFNQGDYVGALAARAQAEAISRVLYPSADTAAGQELRLRQEYFFTSASLQDLIQRHLAEHNDIASLPDYAAIQMNDTHPTIAVAELMRILVDEYGVNWHHAWDITTRTLNYTNHTLLPEALETWPVDLINRLLPRHMQIVFYINWLHLKHATAGGELPVERLADLSIIQEDGMRRVRMGHLAFIGSSRINGVSALHTDLMRQSIFRELDSIYPDRIVNETNGITFRRWLFQANSRLTRLLTDTIGERVLDNPDELHRLERFAGDGGFLARLQDVRKANKRTLASLIHERTGVRADPHALFDVHIKRIHEYKRQLLNILEAVALYRSIRAEPQKEWIPRVKIFAGKAAATYAHAKLIIKLINDVARTVNHDPVVGDRLKIVFLPNYGVSLAETIIPAADLSEQISTAGLEASGTGNMKLALNGALTIGTLDGANIEIRDHVGQDNIFIFGMTADEVLARKRARFTGREAAEASPLLMEVLESIAGGAFSPEDPARFLPVVERVLGYDEFMTAADFDAYWAAQRRIDEVWRDEAAWWQMSLLNTARMCWFSSDRTIREYAEDIWNVPAQPALK